MRKALFALGIVATTAFTPARLEPHPHIRKAIVELEGARNELRNASHDFGGHRVDALAAIDNAIKQLRLAQQFDRK